MKKTSLSLALLSAALATSNAQAFYCNVNHLTNYYGEYLAMFDRNECLKAAQQINQYGRFCRANEMYLAENEQIEYLDIFFNNNECVASLRQ